ncbi:hypothetical protein H2204_003696 [Knufia peltigerae]|uniref:Uncharacterized protein n=1 Tax=Knufia peltigerae TaxID=1002370 RepID=A0AA38Y8Q9_9EURO|nr:hypothetical protein H2204_003696 [Knufia peltigerae]
MVSRFRRREKLFSQLSAHEDQERFEGDSLRSGSTSKWSQNSSNTGKDHLLGAELPFRNGRSKDVEPRKKERSRDRRSDPLGLTVLYEPESSPSVDIVFVHGLGGTSRYTWSKNGESELFWPREWLPYESELSTARIMTFGYNAHFSAISHGAENILNISDFAKDLLFSLKFATGEGQRALNIGSIPIIFVAHSMGGLVVKKAFILGQHDEHYRDLIQAISALVFLSTPHRGSNLAEALNKILSACILTLAPKEYVSELRINSPTLQEINEQFRNLAPKLSIVSFFETLKTSIGLSRMMVLQKDSSILGYPGEISKPLDADHHDVCKYTSHQDPNYISVRNVLKYLVEKHRAQDMPQVDFNSVDELHEISSAFGHPEGPGDDLSFFANRRMPGSCEWTHDDPVFISFLEDESDGPRCLWCTGPPGSGKSVLASSIIQTAEEDEVDHVYYFFRFGDEVKNNLNVLLLSLAYQLASVLPEYRRRLLRLFEDGFNVQKSLPRLLWKKLFASTFLKLHLTQPLLLIIDGLDECDSHSHFLKFLEDFQSFPGCMRFLIISRNTQSLSSGFEKLSKKIPVQQHALQSMKNDLRLYIEEEMTSMHGDDDFKDAIAAELTRKADGNFLWASLVLGEVLQCHTGDAVLEALNEVPEDLEPLYERMDATLAKNCRPSDRAIGKTILMWIACSRYALSLQDLAEALQPEYSNLLDLKFTISRVCGEFVIVDSKGIVSMVHSSARDYLFQNQYLNYHIPKGASHQQIFMKCTTALINANPKIQTGQIRSQAFLLYAASSWPFHMEQGSDFSDQPSLLQLARFFQSSVVLSWIYLLAVAGQLRVLVQASKKMTSFLKKVDRLDETRSPLTHRLREKELVSLWTIDLIRLVGKFSAHLNEQPKLIFKLVAPFCPQDSVIFKQFAVRSAGLGIMVSGLSNPSWDDCLAKFAVDDSLTPLQIKCWNRYFAILVSDGTILLYHAITYEEARRFHHGERVLTWCFNQEGDQIVTCGLKKTMVWNTATGKQLYTFVNPRRSKAITIAFANAEETLVTCCDDRTIRTLSLTQLDGEGWQILDNVLGEDHYDGKQCGSPRCASFNPAGSQIAISYRGIPLAVWSLEDARPFLVGRCQRILGGRQVFSSSASDVQAITWNPMTGHVLGIYNDGCVFKWHPFEADYQESNISVGRVECSPDGKFFVTSSRDGTLRIWDFYHFSPIYQLSYTVPVTSLAIDPNDTRIYDIRESFCSVWEPNALVRMWETEDKSSETMSNRESTQVSHISEVSFESLQPVTTLALESGSLSYAVGNDDGVVTHFTKDGYPAAEVVRTFMTVEHLSWSEDGRCIAASGLGRRLFVKEVNQGNSNQTARSIMNGKADDPIRQLLLSSTGKFLLVVMDRFLNIWSTADQCIVSTRPQVALHRWINCPYDTSKVIGFSFDEIQIIDWQDPELTKHLLQDRSVVDDAAEQHSRVLLFRRPSAQYPMSPGESNKIVDKVLLTVNRTSALVVTSQSTAQGRCERQFMFVGLGDVTNPFTEAKVPATALPPELQATMVIPLGFVAVESSLVAPRAATSSVQQRTFASSERPAVGGGTEMSRAADHVLAFLDHKYWVCTYTLSQTRAGRVKRHFFLPRDWLNMDWLELAVMRPDGALLCPRNGEVALVENGLREEWID